MKTDAEFMVIPPAEAEVIVGTERRGTGVRPLRLREWVKAVREGKMIFMPEGGWRNKPSFHTEMGTWPKKNGMRVCQLKSKRDDGVIGWYVWLEPAPLKFPPGYNQES